MHIDVTYNFYIKYKFDKIDIILQKYIYRLYNEVKF